MGLMLDKGPSMPTDPSIILAGKPPVIPPLDINKTFRTIGELRYLQAGAQAKEQEAARAQELFEETGAGRRLLSSLGTGPVSAAPPAPPAGGPPFDEATLGALPQGGSTPAPAATPAAAAPAVRRRSILDSDVQAELYRIAPHAADDLIKAGLSTHTSTLEGQQKLYESVARSMTSVHDEASYQAWRTMAGTVLPPEVWARIPPNDPGPEARAKMQQGAQDLHTQFTQAIEQSKAATLRMQAQTQQQTEDRMGRKVLVVPGEQGGVPIYEFPQPGTGTGPAGTSPAGTPGTGPIPGTERPRTGEENLAAARLHQAAVSNGRLAQIEAEIAAFGTDPSTDPTRDSGGVLLGDPTGKLVGVGINAQTPAQRDREVQQYLENTPKRQLHEFLETKRLPLMDPTMRPNNAPDTYTGKGLIRVVPSVLEHTLATNPGGLGSTVGAVAGGAAGLVGGSRVGGPAGAVVGSTSAANAGARAGGALGESIGGDLAHKALDPRRQQYYGEQLNFIAAIKGDNLSPDAIALARKQYFPQPGDTEPEVLRKRQVREEALSGLATQTNRPQGMVPRGQTQLPTPGAPTYTMEDVWKTSKATGRSVNDVLADAKRQGIVIR
jgi:hypothetical protein